MNYEALITDLEAAEDLPELLRFSYFAFEQIRQATLDAADSETHGAAALVAAAEAAADGRDAVISAASMPRDGLTRPETARAKGRTRPGHRHSGSLVALSSVLATKLTGVGGTSRAAAAGDRAICQHAALCALEIQALLQGGDW